MATSKVLTALSITLFVVVIASCTERTLSYQGDIQPILERSCYECHLVGGQGYQKSGFLVDSYEGLMKGTKYGPVIEPGSSISSTLYLMVAGKTHSTIRMPHRRGYLSERDFPQSRLG